MFTVVMQNLQRIDILWDNSKLEYSFQSIKQIATEQSNLNHAWHLIDEIRTET